MDDVEADQDPRAMENELLRHEVRHLRARLAAAEESTRAARRAVAKPLDAAPTTKADDLPVARDDLSWLLDRVGRSTPLFAPSDRRRLAELRRRHHLGDGVT